MNIFKAVLRIKETMGLGTFSVEMLFRKRPTQADIIQRMKEKVDPEIVSDEQPTLMWILQEVQKYPIKDEESHRLWWDDSKQSDQLVHPTGSTFVHEITVIEN